MAFEILGTDVLTRTSMAPGDQVTWAAWVKFTAFNSFNTIFLHGGQVTSGGSRDRRGGLLIWNNSGEINLYWTTGRATSQGDAAIAVPTLTAGAWHHVAVAYDYTTFIAKIYLNGVKVFDGAVGGSGAATTDSRTLNVGNTAFTDSPLNGRMQHLAVWSRILTDTEIADIHTRTAIDGHETSLYGYWPFLPIPTSLPTDVSGNSRDLTNSGAASVVDDIEVGTGAILFSGEDYMQCTAGVFPSGDPFTISFWWYAESAAATGLFYIGSLGYAQYFGIYQDETAGIRLHIQVQSVATSGGAAISRGWHHVALTRNGSVFTLYLDQVFYISLTEPITVTPAQMSWGSAYGGRITASKQWSAVLSPAELAVEATTRGPVRMANLASAHGFTTDTDLSDTSGNGQHFSSAGYDLGTTSGPTFVTTGFRSASIIEANVSSASQNGTIPACVAGDLLIALVFNKGSTSFTAPGDWFLLSQVATGVWVASVYYRLAVAGDSFTPVTFSKTANDGILFGVQISAWITGLLAPYSGSSGSVPPVELVPFPAISPSGAAHLAFFALYGDDQTAFAAAMSADTNPDCTTRFETETSLGTGFSIACTSGENDGSAVASRTWASNSVVDADCIGIIIVMVGTPEITGNAAITLGDATVDGDGVIGLPEVTGSAAITLGGLAPMGHKVGPAYHILGQSYADDQFIRRYHDPPIRSQVRAELAAMASGGATAVRTRLWQVEPEETNVTTYNSFPFSAQEGLNIRLYAQDVREFGLEPIFTMLWLWCAKYSVGTPATTVGECGYTWAQFLTRAKASVDVLASSLTGVGSIVEIEGEMALGGGTPNGEQFLLDLWPYFANAMTTAGLVPAIYSVSGHSESIFDPWTDPLYPILNDRVSMFWIYRTVKFMEDQGWTLPSRIDVSCYMNVVAHTYDEWAEKVVGDFEAVFPGKTMGIAETFYDQQALAAWSKALQKRGWQVVVSFWPMVMGGDPGVTLMPPFDYAPSLPMGMFLSKGFFRDVSTIDGSASITLGAIAPSAHEIGPNYHLIGQTYESDQFIRRYHEPLVRNQVLAELEAMAAGGATTVRTRLWQTEPELTNTSMWNCFPLSAQEGANLRAYVIDVRNSGLSPIFTLLWQWAANYTMGTPATTVGAHNYTWAQFLGFAQTSINVLAAAVSGYCTRIELDGEIAVGATPNAEQFLTDLWPYFRDTMTAAGITPSIYFISIQEETIFNPWTDPLYPILNDHGSMFWIYRSTKYMEDQGWTLPSRIDFSLYFHPNVHTAEEWAERVMADFQAVYPGKTMGASETYYDAEHLRAWAKAFQKRGWPVVVTFWPLTPSSPPDLFTLAPYDFAGALPAGAFLGTGAQEIVAGTVDLILGGLTVAGTGTSDPPTGVTGGADITLGAATVASAGDVTNPPPSGFLDLTLGAATLAAAGDAIPPAGAITGSLGLTLGDLTLIGIAESLGPPLAGAPPQRVWSTRGLNGMADFAGSSDLTGFSFDPTLRRAGGRSLKFAKRVGVDSWVESHTGLALAECFARCYFRTDGPAGHSCSIFSIMRAADTPLLTLYLETTGQLRAEYRNGAGAMISLGNSAGLVEVNAWNLFEIRLKTGAAGVVTIKMNRTQAFDAAPSVSTDPIDRLKIGVNGLEATCWYSDIAVNRVLP